MRVADAGGRHEGEAPGFLDSNVVMYLLSDHTDKAVCTEQLLKNKPVISVQALNEVTHVCRRKIAMQWSEIEQFLALVRSFCTLVPLTEATHDEARRIAERLKLKLQVQHFKMLFLGVVMSVIYSHLSAEERAAIMLGRKSGHSLRLGLK